MTVKTNNEKKNKIYELLEDYMFEILAEENVPYTDDILTEYMQDGEKVQEAYDIMMERIERYFRDNHDVISICWSTQNDKGATK